MNLGLNQFHAGHEIYFLPYLQLKIWTFSVGKFIKWRSDCVMQSSAGSDFQWLVISLQSSKSLNKQILSRKFVTFYLLGFVPEVHSIILFSRPFGPLPPRLYQFLIALVSIAYENILRIDTTGNALLWSLMLGSVTESTTTHQHTHSHTHCTHVMTKASVRTTLTLSSYSITLYWAWTSSTAKWRERYIKEKNK